VPEWYDTVYRVILGRANARRWVHLLPDAVFVDVPDATADLLADRDPAAMASLALQIDAKTTTLAPDDGWFVKCGTCSTKHDHTIPTPVFSGTEAVADLLHSPKVRAQFKKHRAQGVMVRPWDRRIGDTNELRVFVRERRVTGVSQQACYDVVPVVSMVDPQDIVDASQRCYDRMRSLLRPGDRFDYECTFDAFFITDSEGTIEVVLIEINSEAFGWGPAGASLFHWKDDPPAKPDEPPVFYIATV
jgi:hypothetical protein